MKPKNFSSSNLGLNYEDIGDVYGQMTYIGPISKTQQLIEDIMVSKDPTRILKKTSTIPTAIASSSNIHETKTIASFMIPTMAPQQSKTQQMIESFLVSKSRGDQPLNDIFSTFKSQAPKLMVLVQPSSFLEDGIIDITPHTIYVDQPTSDTSNPLESKSPHLITSIQLSSSRSPPMDVVPLTTILSYPSTNDTFPISTSHSPNLITSISPSLNSRLLIDGGMSPLTNLPKAILEVEEINEIPPFNKAQILFPQGVPQGSQKPQLVNDMFQGDHKLNEMLPPTMETTLQNPKMGKPVLPSITQFTPQTQLNIEIFPPTLTPILQPSMEDVVLPSIPQFTPQTQLNIEIFPPTLAPILQHAMEDVEEGSMEESMSLTKEEFTPKIQVENGMFPPTCATILQPSMEVVEEGPMQESISLTKEEFTPKIQVENGMFPPTCATILQPSKEVVERGLMEESMSPLTEELTPKTLLKTKVVSPINALILKPSMGEIEGKAMEESMSFSTKEITTKTQLENGLFQPSLATILQPLIEEVMKEPKVFPSMKKFVPNAQVNNYENFPSTSKTILQSSMGGVMEEPMFLSTKELTPTKQFPLNITTKAPMFPPTTLDRSPLEMITHVIAPPLIAMVPLHSLGEEKFPKLLNTFPTTSSRKGEHDDLQPSSNVQKEVSKVNISSHQNYVLSQILQSGKLQEQQQDLLHSQDDALVEHLQCVCAPEQSFSSNQNVVISKEHLDLKHVMEPKQELSSHQDIGTLATCFEITKCGIEPQDWHHENEECKTTISLETNSTLSNAISSKSKYCLHCLELDNLNALGSLHITTISMPYLTKRDNFIGNGNTTSVQQCIFYTHMDQTPSNDNILKARLEDEGTLEEIPFATSVEWHEKQRGHGKGGDNCVMDKFEPSFSKHKCESNHQIQINHINPSNDNSSNCSTQVIFKLSKPT
jgi:hypothetical protein